MIKTTSGLVECSMRILYIYPLQGAMWPFTFKTVATNIQDV